jgi:hypothetical protein
MVLNPCRMQAPPWTVAIFSIRSLCWPIEPKVSPLRLLVDVFVNTFGITPPTPETEAKAGRVIAIMLAGVVIVLVAAGWLLGAALTR